MKTPRQFLPNRNVTKPMPNTNRKNKWQEEQNCGTGVRQVRKLQEGRRKQIKGGPNKTTQKKRTDHIPTKLTDKTGRKKDKKQRRMNRRKDVAKKGRLAVSEGLWEPRVVLGVVLGNYCVSHRPVIETGKTRDGSLSGRLGLAWESGCHLQRRKHRNLSWWHWK